jgi:two-component system response regulator AtoC
LQEKKGVREEEKVKILPGGTLTPGVFHALVLDDDEISLQFIAGVLAEAGFDVSTATTVRQARDILSSTSVDAIFLDILLPDGTGLDLLKKLESRASTQAIVITAHASLDSVREAMQQGASDYLQKPIEIERLNTIVKNIARALDKENEIGKLRNELRELGQFGPLVGASAEMKKVYDLVLQVAPTGAAVFIRGESGTGKELVAEAVHMFSRRSRGPFVPINCGAIPPTLMESELFGHEKGSFTGADRQHRGHFERASGGTLFLDEITEMPIELQVKLLRVLETGTVSRLGGDRPIQAEARIIAATNRQPEQAVAEGKLREDLFYRLNVFPIQLPPLREREDDASLIAGYFLGKLNTEAGMAKRFSTSALESLRAYSWPGNVRELKNIVQRAYIKAPEVLQPSHLFEKPPGAAPPPLGPTVSLRIGTTLADAEKELIRATLSHLDGDKKRAAEVLGISLRTLYYRLREDKDAGLDEGDVEIPEDEAEPNEAQEG